MPSRKGKKNRFPVNRFLAIKQNQDVQLACALVEDKEYVVKAKKIKWLESKVQHHQSNSPLCLLQNIMTISKENNKSNLHLLKCILFSFHPRYNQIVVHFQQP